MLDLRQITSRRRPLACACASDCAPIRRAGRQQSTQVPDHSHTHLDLPLLLAFAGAVLPFPLSSYCSCPHTPPHYYYSQPGSFIIFLCPSQPISCLEHSTYTQPWPSSPTQYQQLLPTLFSDQSKHIPNHSNCKSAFIYDPISPAADPNPRPQPRSDSNTSHSNTSNPQASADQQSTIDLINTDTRLQLDTYSTTAHLITHIHHAVQLLPSVDQG
jgi:hypothetical protein